MNLRNETKEFDNDGFAFTEYLRLRRFSGLREGGFFAKAIPGINKTEKEAKAWDTSEVRPWATEYPCNGTNQR
jgi:hypothetical protein